MRKLHMGMGKAGETFTSCNLLRQHSLKPKKVTNNLSGFRNPYPNLFPEPLQGSAVPKPKNIAEASNAQCSMLISGSI